MRSLKSILILSTLFWLVSPTFAIWLSVDPLSDSYPHISPYAYCGNNPIKYVDPDGKKIIVGTWYGRMFAKVGINNFEYKVYRDINKLKVLSSTLAQTINNLEASESICSVKPHTERKDYDVLKVRLNWNGYDAEANNIYYDPDNVHGAIGIRPPEAGLMHEFGHAENDDQGKRIIYNRKKALSGDIVEKEKWNKNERHSIELENEVYKSEGLNIKRDEEYIK